MYMREPTITTGFIIFREGNEDQLASGGKGHWKTARDWINKSHFKDEFLKVINNPKINVYDYDDFITDYVGAIRLYYSCDKLNCYIPRGNNNEYKSYLKDFFCGNNVTICGKKLSYNVFGDVSFEKNPNYPNHISNYNQLLITNSNGDYCYNPNRIGD